MEVDAMWKYLSAFAQMAPRGVENDRSYRNYLYDALVATSNALKHAREQALIESGARALERKSFSPLEAMPAEVLGNIFSHLFAAESMTPQDKTRMVCNLRIMCTRFYHWFNEYEKMDALRFKSAAHMDRYLNVVLAPGRSERLGERFPRRATVNGIFSKKLASLLERLSSVCDYVGLLCESNNNAGDNLKRQLVQQLATNPMFTRTYVHISVRSDHNVLKMLEEQQINMQMGLILCSREISHKSLQSSHVPCNVPIVTNEVCIHIRPTKLERNHKLFEMLRERHIYVHQLHVIVRVLDDDLNDGKSTCDVAHAFTDRLLSLPHFGQLGCDYRGEAWLFPQERCVNIHYLEQGGTRYLWKKNDTVQSELKERITAAFLG
jgi:hypothetical protein